MPMSDFDRLKDLLLAEERSERARQNNALRERLEANFNDLPSVLPELLRRAHTDDRLARALEKPLAQGLERLARTQKTLLISVLFPLIGPIIRRSISETLAQLVRDMNRAVEHSVSPMGLRWRWEAIKTGVPFAQVVLKYTLRYRVEHLLLVNNEGGLLLAHVANGDAELADSDAVAAMLSALQDFARDAVLARADEGLNSVNVGGMSLKILRGPLMHLAVAVRGEMSEIAHQRLEVLLESVHSDQHDAEQLEASKDEFREQMMDWLFKYGQESSQAKDDATEKPGKRAWMHRAAGAALAFALLYGVGLWIWHGYKARELEAALSSTPGILAEVEYRGGKFHVRGSRDPMADDVAVLAKAVNISEKQLDLNALSPQLSLEPLLWTRRLRAAGELPDGVILTNRPNAVSLSGEISAQALTRLRASLKPWQAVVNFDLSQLSVRGATVEQRRRELIRAIALMRIDLTLDQQSLENSVDALRVQAQALLDTAPDQVLHLTLVEFPGVGESARVASAPALAVASRLRSALGRVTLRVIVANERDKYHQILAPSEISLQPASP